MAKTLGHRPRPRHNRPRLSDMSAPIDPLDPLPSIEGGGSTLLDERRTSTDDGDHERFAHYVKKDKILESAVSGQPVRALCGKKWVPAETRRGFRCARIVSRFTRGYRRGEAVAVAVAARTERS